MRKNDPGAAEIKLNPAFDTEQVKNAVMFLLDHSTLWTIPATAHIFSYLIGVVSATNDISPTVSLNPKVTIKF